jgi:hypothetical protein
VEFQVVAGVPIHHGDGGEIKMPNFLGLISDVIRNTSAHLPSLYFTLYWSSGSLDGSIMTVNFVL